MVHDGKRQCIVFCLHFWEEEAIARKLRNNINDTNSCLAHLQVDDFHTEIKSIGAYAS